MEIIQANNEISSLIDQCKLGNRSAQMKIYNKYYKMVFSSAYRIVQNKQDAEDLMQEAFLSCFNQLDNLKDPERFGGWLKKTAINKSINYIHRHRGKWMTLKENDAKVLATDPKDEELENIQVKLIYQEINSLPEGYRIILTLYLIEGYDHEEIATILKIKSSTSRSQYARARQKLKELLLTKYERQFEK